MKVRTSGAAGLSPTVYIERQAYEDMHTISKATKDEVAWFCHVTEHPQFVFVLDDVFLPHQQSNGGTVEIEPEMLAQMFEEYLTAERSIDDYNKLRCWGHSHHTMGVSPSSQDATTIDNLCHAIKATFLAIRMNHKGNVEVDVAMTNGITYEAVDVIVGIPDQDREAAWRALVKERLQPIVHKPKVVQHVGKGGAASAEAIVVGSRGGYTHTGSYDPWARPGKVHDDYVRFMYGEQFEDVNGVSVPTAYDGFADLEWDIEWLVSRVMRGLLVQDSKDFVDEMTSLASEHNVAYAHVRDTYNAAMKDETEKDKGGLA